MNIGEARFPLRVAQPASRIKTSEVSVVPRLKSGRNAVRYSHHTHSRISLVRLLNFKPAGAGDALCTEWSDI